METRKKMLYGWEVETTEGHYFTLCAHCGPGDTVPGDCHLPLEHIDDVIQEIDGMPVLCDGCGRALLDRGIDNSPI